MRNENHQEFRSPAFGGVLGLVFVFLMACQGSTPTEPGPDFDLEPFKEQARNSDCADIRNRLFLIDEAMVFSEQEGNCVDAAYSQVLYGTSPDEVLCFRRDSVGGVQEGCNDNSISQMFDTIVANLDRPDLGLDPDHQVEQIPF